MSKAPRRTPGKPRAQQTGAPEDAGGPAGGDGRIQPADCGKEFAQSQLTPYQKMQSDIAAAKGTPNEQTVPISTEINSTPGRRKSARLSIPRSDEMSFRNGTAAAGNGRRPRRAAARPRPRRPIRSQRPAREVYAQGGDYSTPHPHPQPRGSVGPQPVLPAKKPLSAHEQTAIDEADKAVMANQNAINNLQYAKELSQKAASGSFALERGKAGSQLRRDVWRRRKRNGDAAQYDHQQCGRSVESNLRRQPI